MTRSVPVRVGVALVVLLSMLAASVGPVGAMNAQAQADGLAAGSQHTTDADFQNAQTLDNLAVDGSGDAAHVSLASTGSVYDGFEDQDLTDDWSGATSGWTIQSSVVHSGSYALQSDSSSLSDRITRSIPDTTTETLSYWGYTEDASQAARPLVRYRNSNDDSVIAIAVDSGSVVGDAGSIIYQEGGTWYDTGDDIQNNAWYQFALEDIDYSADTATLVVRDDSDTTVSTTSIAFSTDITEFTSVRTTTDGTDFYLDDFSTGLTAVDSAQYVSDTHAVSGAEEAAINIEQASNVTFDMAVEYYDGSSWQAAVSGIERSSPDNYSVSWSGGNDASQWRTRVDVTVTGENPQFQLADESILFSPHSPEASNASPADNETLSSQETTLSVNVTDDDFQTVQGDSVDVTFVVDGDEVGQSTLSSDGTASTTVTTLGETSWYAVFEDEYGQVVQTETRTFNTPNTLRVLDELDPQELVDDNVSVTVRAYAGDTAISRNVTDGTANLTGFPMDQPVVITTSAEGWVDRRIIIEDLTEQQRIYLLNESAETVPITFSLSDKTGSYPPESSRLSIQKALNVTGTESLQWQTITGDYFAADLQFPTTLAANQRYRIVIQNEQGDQRVLGSYIPSEPTTTTLSIGEIVWDIPESEGVYSTSRIDDEGRLEVLYNDTAGATTRLNITAWNRSTGEEVYSTIESDVQQSVTRVPVDSENIIVSVQAEREDAPDYESSGQVGRPDVEQGVGFEKWLRLGTQVLLLGMAGLVVGQMPKKGGLVIVPLAFGVTWLGFWTIHPASLGIAGVLAIVSATNRGGY